MNKETALPLNHLVGGDIPGPLWAAGWEAGIEAQRDCDWERVKPLVKAARLQARNTKRDMAAGFVLGDDDYEAWTALTNALAQLGEEVKP